VSGEAATLDDIRIVEEFLNTLDERTFSRHGTAHTGGETLSSPGALASWLASHGLIPPGTRLREADLTAALALRSALRFPEAAPNGLPLHLAPDPAGGLRLVAQTGTPGLDPIVETTARYVARGQWHRLKLCAAPDCRWAFYDTSRSGAGRWCSMAACGNRHKTRMYRKRHHQPA
jgi:hypothetical protein